MSGIHLVRDYPHPPTKVWRALTDPELIARWGMRPENFAPVVGTRFRFIGKPGPGWRGIVECEVLEARPPSILRYSWIGNENDPPTEVTFALAPHAGGTRLTFSHSGFSGIGGFVFTRLVMGPGWRKTLGTKLPEVLRGIAGEDGLPSTRPPLTGDGP